MSIKSIWQKQWHFFCFYKVYYQTYWISNFPYVLMALFEYVNDCIMDIYIYLLLDKTCMGTRIYQNYLKTNCINNVQYIRFNRSDYWIVWGHYIYYVLIRQKTLYYTFMLWCLDGNFFLSLHIRNDDVDLPRVDGRQNCS